MKKTIIVMPVANEEKTMGRIIEEILSLGYEELYLYPVIDSYSKDKTERIIREYEEKTNKVKLIFLKIQRVLLVAIWKALKERWQMEQSE